MYRNTIPHIPATHSKYLQTTTAGLFQPYLSIPQFFRIGDSKLVFCRKCRGQECRHIVSCRWLVCTAEGSYCSERQFWCCGCCPCQRRPRPDRPPRRSWGCCLPKAWLTVYCGWQSPWSTLQTLAGSRCRPHQTPQPASLHSKLPHSHLCTGISRSSSL